MQIEHLNTKLNTKIINVNDYNSILSARVLPEWVKYKISKWYSICRNYKTAFSLVEMLMALLVASLLLAALAPVMTRRMDESKISVSGVGTVNNGNETHGVKIFEYDAMADSDKEYSKYDFLVPQGVYTISLVLQAGGGGGGGSTSGYTSYNNVLDTSDLATQTVTIEDNLIGIKNLRVDLTGGGGGGGSAQPTVIDCKDSSIHKYINPTQGNGTQQCVNKFNVGNSGGPAVVSGAIKCIQGETDASEQAKCLKCADSTSSSYAKCYYIGTYTDCSDDPAGGWTGCGRTAVQWHVANDACNAYTGAGLSKGKWRLPKIADAQKWTTYRSDINEGKGANGLQICQYNESVAVSVKVARCGGNSSRCYGSLPENDCDIDYYSMYDSVGTNMKAFFNSYIQVFDNPGQTNQGLMHNAMSARCLTVDNGAFTFAYKTGGGGGSGARIYNYTLPETYNGNKLLEKGNKITISRGNNGGGGFGTGVNGSNGSPTCLTVYNSGNASIFYLCANGGDYGRGASAANYGNGGNAVETCRLGTSSTNYQNVNCSTIGNGVAVVSKGGNNGVSNASASYNTTVSGGAGGVSTYNTSIAGGSGGNGIASKTVEQAAIDGKSPSASGSNVPYGAGGGGGSSGRGADSSSVIAGNGGSGYVGYAKITYDIERTGGSGGGGGGGSMIAVASLDVEEGKTYEVITGKGGKGGTVNGDGNNGYPSSFKYSDGKIIKTNEGKGGKCGNHTGTYGTGGEGGAGGAKSSINIGYGMTASAGKSGVKGYNYDVSKTKKSIGGNGGVSGIGTDGGCGGLSFYYSDSSYAPSDKSSLSVVNNCKITNANADNGLYLLNTLIMGTDYGKAGAGGGGGGFESYSLYGIGGDGGNGYVYIKW